MQTNYRSINYGISMSQLLARREARKSRKEKIRFVGEMATIFVLMTFFVLYVDNSVAIRDFVFGK